MERLALQDRYDRIPYRRDWIWRGWRTHYAYAHPASTGSQKETVPLLLLHGFGASLDHWRYNLPVLSQSHPTYALDLLGFGASQKASIDYIIPLWVEQVYDFWRTFIRQPLVLVGHSLGSIVGLAVASAHPEMLRGLVMFTLPDASVLDLPAWLRSPWLKPYLNAPAWILKRILTFPPIFAPLFRAIRRPAMIRRWARGVYGQVGQVDDELVHLLSRPAFDRGATRALAAMLKAQQPAYPDYSARTILPRLTIPMLLIWGKQDPAVPPMLAQKCLSYNPRLTLIEVDDVGHCAHDESPEAMNQAILDWIAFWVNSPTAPFASSSLTIPPAEA